MAEIRSYGFIRHFRGESSAYGLEYRSGALRREGRGLAFWFLPLSTSIAEVPVDDRDLAYLFHGRSSDYQDATAQGVITYRVTDPRTLAHRIDFSVDLRTGAYLKQPLEQLSVMLTQLAQQFAWAFLAQTPIRDILALGHERIRARILEGFAAEEGLAAMGIEIASVRVSSVKPTADLEKAIEMPMREKIQQDADEATFARRALAVEKERAIQENELQNKIELARREEVLIRQRGQNDQRRATEQAQALGIEVQGKAERTRIEAAAQAESTRLVDDARVEGEKARMEIYRTMPPSALLGLAAQQLAGKLERIENINVTPELLGPMLTQLVRAGTHHLERGESR